MAAKNNEQVELIDIESDIEFLEAYLEKLRNWYSGLEHIDKHEFYTSDELPTTSDFEERIARLADEAKIDIIVSGKTIPVDGNLFRNLFFEADPNYRLSFERRRTCKQIQAIPKIIAKMKKDLESQKTVPANHPSSINLSENHLRILFYLKDQQIPKKQQEIEAAIDRNRKTISALLKRLREEGLTKRPNGDRGGEVITDTGRQRIEGMEPPK